MRFSIPIIIILVLLNIYQALKPVAGEHVQPALPDRKSLFNEKTELELAKAHDEILVLKALLNAYRDANVKQLSLSAYTARPEEGDEDVNSTAVMTTPVPGLTAAVSRDLKGWLGKRVYVKGFGVRLVSDLMHPRHEKSIDLLVEDVDTANAIGVMPDVLVTLIEPLGVPDADFDLSQFCESIQE